MIQETKNIKTGKLTITGKDKTVFKLLVLIIMLFTGVLIYKHYVRVENRCNLSKAETITVYNDFASHVHLKLEEEITNIKDFGNYPIESFSSSYFDYFLVT